jgi:hypothetical protein
MNPSSPIDRQIQIWDEVFDKIMGVTASSGGRACALRAEPDKPSQAEPLVPNARNRAVLEWRNK